MLEARCRSGDQVERCRGCGSSHNAANTFEVEVVAKGLRRGDGPTTNRSAASHRAKQLFLR